MPKTFVVKMPTGPVTRTGEYVVVTCPKCGKKSYGVVGQKGKTCPVCRRQYSMPGGEEAPHFKTPAEACRFIQAEEIKRAGRLDFAPVVGGFRPIVGAPVVARTNKVITETRSLDAQFLTWVRHYFSTVIGNTSTGVPMAVFIAAAAKAGFTGTDILIEKAIVGGILVRPKPYSVWLAGI